MNIEAKLEQVRHEYLLKLDSRQEHLNTVLGYSTAVQGKMLRPRLLLTAAATLGEECFNSRRTLLLATGIEILHNATLFHDDVVDHTDMRRDRPSINAKFGNTAAVLVGDYLLTLLMQILDEVDDREATRRVNQTVQGIIKAELLAQSVDLTSTTYLQIIDGKTAGLFALAAELGNPRYHDFGLHYGRLFQLQDDLHDGEATPWTLPLIEQEKNAIKQMHDVLNL